MEKVRVTLYAADGWIRFSAVFDNPENGWDWVYSFPDQSWTIAKFEPAESPLVLKLASFVSKAV